MEFHSGEQVEVIMKDKVFRGSFYEATVLSKEVTSHYKVKYKTVSKEDDSGQLEEVIHIDQLRPMPPSIPVMCFSLHALVDAYENDGWWPGIINGKFQSDYFVSYASIRKEKPYPLEKLRIHQEWSDGEWISGRSENKSFKKERANLEFDENEEISLTGPTFVEFQTGEEVEVMLEEEGFENSYFEAKIISKENPSQYKVVYKTVMKEDKSGPLEEVVRVDQLRPSPPHNPVSCFSLYELADVYTNGGRWAGYIYGKFQSEYIVYFPPTQQELPYPLEKLRVHQDWSNGLWISYKEHGLHSQPNKKTKRE